MLDSFKANADARKHKDDTEVVEAYVYEKSMNLIVGNDGVMRVAYLILFKDYDDNCYQCLLFDKPDTYAMFEKHNVCMITIKSSPIKFPDTVFPVVDVKFKERK